MGTIIHEGLEGIIATQTRLSSVDGQIGELVIAGYPLEDIAPYATFEEMLFLLWNDQLPTRSELEQLRDSLIANRQIDSLVIDVLRDASQKQISIMDALRMTAGMMSQNISNNPKDDAIRLVAVFPTLVASYWRLLQGKTPIQPRRDLSHADNMLYMLTGEEPTLEQTRALNTYLNTIIDHGLNASTFAARVIIATQSDMISAIVGAIGALKGPLHGGAPGPALDMVFEIGSIDKAENYLRQKIEQGERLMGFGHRVYKVRDPRADVLGKAADNFFLGNENEPLYELAKHVEKTAVTLLAEYKPGRNLQTNVEFYTALILHGIGLETDLFTPIFAVGRVGGWTAHCFEQIERGRIIRPSSAYSGVKNRQWLPLTKRT